MPYRKTYRKRAPARRKPTYRRKTYSRSGYRKNNNKGKMPTYMFKRNVERINVNSDVTDTFGGYDFSLSDVPGFTEFSGMFDMYRINMVKISFLPLTNVSLAGSAAVNAESIYSNRLFTVIDKNDANPPATMGEMRQDSTLKWTPNNRIHKRIIYPKLSQVNDALVGTYTVAGKPWLNVNSPQANYYGIKWGLEGSVLNSQAYRVEAVYYMQFKQSK